MDWCILVLGGVYLAYMTLTMTTFYFDMPDRYKIVLLGLMCLVAGIRILFIGLRSWRVWASIGMAAVYCCVYAFSGYAFLLCIAVLTVGFLDVDYRKIIAVYLISVGLPVLVAVISAKLCIIDNIVRQARASGKPARFAMGMQYPTDFAAIVLFLFFFLWVIQGYRLKWASLILPISSFAIAWQITDSRTSVLGSLLFFIAILVCLLWEKRKARRGKSLWWLMLLPLLVMPVCAVLTICLVKAYGAENGLAQWIDLHLSHRLAFAWYAWNGHGIHAFGSYFELIGNGGVNSGQAIGYNFIDISYMLILIRYGFVLFALLPFSWGYTLVQAEKTNVRLVMIMLILCLNALSEHHFIEMNYNIALVMPFAAFPPDLKQQVTDT